jgi:hypothetical protein
MIQECGKPEKAHTKQPSFPFLRLGLDRVLFFFFLFNELFLLLKRFLAGLDELEIKQPSPIQVSR